MLVKLFVRRAGAKAGHADENSVRADNRVPALADAGLDGDVDFGLADDRRALVVRQRQQKLKARYRDYACRDFARGEELFGVGRDGDFRSCREQRYDGRIVVSSDQLVGAASAAVALVKTLAQLRQVLPRQSEHAWAVLAFERCLPAFDGLDRIAGAENFQIGNGAERRELLDRLVCRAV